MTGKNMPHVGHCSVCDIAIFCMFFWSNPPKVWGSNLSGDSGFAVELPPFVTKESAA